MKLQLAFDTLEIEQALKLAELMHDKVAIIEIGTLLLYAHGAHAIRKFRETLPTATLLADIKIVDRGKEAASLALSAGADWITVLAGTSKSVIHSAAATAHAAGKSVMLDLIDSPSPGQSALEAASLGVDALLFHKSVDDEDIASTLIDQWEMVRGNTKLPIYISVPSSSDKASAIIDLHPQGLVISTSVTESENPVEELEKFRRFISS